MFALLMAATMTSPDSSWLGHSQVCLAGQGLQIFLTSIEGQLSIDHSEPFSSGMTVTKVALTPWRWNKNLMGMTLAVECTSPKLPFGERETHFYHQVALGSPDFLVLMREYSIHTSRLQLRDWVFPTTRTLSRKFLTR